MGDTNLDPADHFRTAQPHAGLAVKDNFYWPGLILLVVAAFGLTGVVVATAYRRYEWVSTMVLIAVLGAIAATLWFVLENRRVMRIEDQWTADHRLPPPTRGGI